MTRKGKYRMENLVVLEYSENECYTNVVSAGKKIQGLEIDSENGLWSFREWKDIEIGESRNINDYHGIARKYGVIGVYDRTNTKHLDFMVSAGREATKSRGSVID